MIITCTECNKKFQVPDSAIPPGGRTVQCSSCSHEWKQLPVKKPKDVEKTTATFPKKSSSPKVRQTPKKSSGLTPYSKEYMQQKWGTTVQSYATQKGLSKKSTNIKRSKKQKPAPIKEKPGFGFFNYIITIFILSVFFIGILNFERGRLTRKFPFLEPYIDHFFESLEILIDHFFESVEIFKILILDFFR